MPESLASSFASRFGSRSTVSKEYKCTVQLLDDVETIQVDVKYWLDPAKPILKQIKGTQPFVLRFRVKYYPADPQVLKEEITRYQLFLQLRRDLLHGRLYCPHNDAAHLGAYIVQSEIGDYNPDEHKDGYVSEYKLFLKQTAKLEDKIATVHSTLLGLTPADAEFEFLRRASSLDTYGYDPYTVKDAKLGQIYVGITHQGILVYHANRKVHHIKWENLEKVDYLGKEFFIYPKPSYFKDDLSSIGLPLSLNANSHTLQTETSEVGEEKEGRKGEEATSGAEEQDRPAENGDGEGAEDDNGKSKKPATPPSVLKYQCSSATFCKHLWKFSLAQRGFFTEDKGSHVKQVTSRRRIPLLARGSTFRYTGRVLQEIAEEATPQREQPSFMRVHLEKQPSRQERGFPWMNKYSTLPRSKKRAEENGKIMSKEAPEPRDLTLNYTEGLSETTGELSPVCDVPTPHGEGGLLGELSLQASAPSGTSTPSPIALSEGLESSNPLCNSTPVKKEAPRQNHLAPSGSASLKDPQKPSQSPATSSSSGGFCSWVFRQVFTGLLLSIILFGVIVAIMEVKDRQFRGYVHSVPGMETFRHSYYEPGRTYFLRTYGRLAGVQQGEHGWFP